MQKSRCGDDVLLLAFLRSVTILLHPEYVVRMLLMGSTLAQRFPAARHFTLVGVGWHDSPERGGRLYVLPCELDEWLGVLGSNAMLTSIKLVMPSAAHLNAGRVAALLQALPRLVRLSLVVSDGSQPAKPGKSSDGGSAASPTASPPAEARQAMQAWQRLQGQGRNLASLELLPAVLAAAGARVRELWLEGMEVTRAQFAGLMAAPGLEALQLRDCTLRDEQLHPPWSRQAWAEPVWLPDEASDGREGGEPSGTSALPNGTVRHLALLRCSSSQTHVSGGVLPSVSVRALRSLAIDPPADAWELPACGGTGGSSTRHSPAPSPLPTSDLAAEVLASLPRMPRLTVLRVDGVLPQPVPDQQPQQLLMQQQQQQPGGMADMLLLVAWTLRVAARMPALAHLALRQRVPHALQEAALRLTTLDLSGLTLADVGAAGLRVPPSVRRCRLCILGSSVCDAELQAQLQAGEPASAADGVESAAAALRALLDGPAPASAAAVRAAAAATSVASLAQALAHVADVDLVIADNEPLPTVRVSMGF